MLKWQAAAQFDPGLQQDFLDMEARWLKLARSYMLTEQFADFSKSRLTDLLLWQSPHLEANLLNLFLGLLDPIQHDLKDNRRKFASGPNPLRPLASRLARPDF
jgi:hypothetical protein